MYINNFLFFFQKMLIIFFSTSFVVYFQRNQFRSVFRFYFACLNHFVWNFLIESFGLNRLGWIDLLESVWLESASLNQLPCKNSQQSWTECELTAFENCYFKFETFNYNIANIINIKTALSGLHDYYDRYITIHLMTPTNLTG